MTKEPTWLYLSEVAGQIAAFAVRQSPYLVPDNLEPVLRKFQESAWDEFGVAKDSKGGMRQFQNRAELWELLWEHLLPIPEVQAWNARKNGRDGAGFVSAHWSPPEPDDDFIDLDALVQNVVMTLVPNDPAPAARRAEAS